jgi:hypothetical protein
MCFGTGSFTFPGIFPALFDIQLQSLTRDKFLHQFIVYYGRLATFYLDSFDLLNFVLPERSEASLVCINIEPLSET